MSGDLFSQMPFSPGLVPNLWAADREKSSETRGQQHCSSWLTHANLKQGVQQLSRVTQPEISGGSQTPRSVDTIAQTTCYLLL